MYTCIQWGERAVPTFKERAEEIIVNGSHSSLASTIAGEAPAARSTFAEKSMAT